MYCDHNSTLILDYEDPAEVSVGDAIEWLREECEAEYDNLRSDIISAVSYYTDYDRMLYSVVDELEREERGLY